MYDAIKFDNCLFCDHVKKDTYSLINCKHVIELSGAGSYKAKADTCDTPGPGCPLRHKFKMEMLIGEYLKQHKAMSDNADAFDEYPDGCSCPLCDSAKEMLNVNI